MGRISWERQHAGVCRWRRGWGWYRWLVVDGGGRGGGVDGVGI